MYDKVVNNWNAQADSFNSWEHLSDAEKVEWTIKYTAMRCREIAQQRYLASNQAVEIDEKISDEFGV